MTWDEMIETIEALAKNPGMCDPYIEEADDDCLNIEGNMNAAQLRTAADWLDENSTPAKAP